MGTSKPRKHNRSAKRRVPQTTESAPALRIHQAVTNGFLDVQCRLYRVKATINAAHALAHAQEENCDLALILEATAAELQVIADGMGNHLPVYVPGGVR
jgi:hypothetical protein